MNITAIILIGIISGTILITYQNYQTLNECNKTVIIYEEIIKNQTHTTGELINTFQKYKQGNQAIIEQCQKEATECQK